jgi:hypothetical protein
MRKTAFMLTLALVCGMALAQAASQPRDPKLEAAMDKLRQALPEYEAFCDQAEKASKALEAGAKDLAPNVRQALQEAQLRIEVIRSIRTIMEKSPATVAAPGARSADAAAMLPKWKEGIEYYLDCAKAGKDPFEGMTAGLRTVRSKMDGELLFYRFALPPGYDKAKKYPVDVHLHCSGALVWRATWVDGKPSGDPKDANRG